MLVDTHAHLEAIEDLEGALDRAKENGVTKIITIGTSIATSKKAIGIAQKYSSSDLAIYATCGLHPQDARGETANQSLDRCIDTLKQILNRVQDDGIVVAVGECGLDYYPAGNTGHVTSDTERKLQRELLGEQIKLAQELKLPLVIHCRNGWNEIFDLLSKYNHYPSSEPFDETQGKLRESKSYLKNSILSGKFSTSPAKGGTSSNSKLTGVFHSFTGDWTAAKKALNLGFYISFSGIVTFKNAPEVCEVAKKAPLDRILIETDSPFLAPSPLRGELNEPKNVKIIGKFLAEIRKESLDLISSVTTANAVKLFKL